MRSSLAPTATIIITIIIIIREDVSAITALRVSKNRAVRNMAIAMAVAGA